MRVYYYRPTAHRHPDQRVAEIACRVERLLMHVLEPSASESLASDGWTYPVRRDLPRGAPGRSWGPLSVAQRIRIYKKRARLRKQAIEGRDYDIVHIDQLNYVTDAHGLQKLRGAGRVLVGWVHDVEPHVHRLPLWLEHSLLKRQYAALDRIIVAHSTLREHLLADYAVPSERVQVIPLPIVAGPAGVGSTVEGQTVLFFGFLRSNKGLEVLLRAVRSSTDPDLSLVVAGHGDPELMSLTTRAYREDERITGELGRISSRRKAKLFKAARVVVLPYTSLASQSGVLRDAYAFARPVVVTDVGAIGPAVREEGSGLVVPPRDSHALLKAITTLAKDDELWRRCQEAQLRIAPERSPARVAERMVGVYQEALENRAG